MRRKQFLVQFLGALGAIEIRWRKETETSISGTAVYERDDPEETQDFIWHRSEADVPNEEVKNLAKLLNDRHLLSIDKITISRDALRTLYSRMIGRLVSVQEFEALLESLEAVEVPMVDEGRETDVFFIHE